MPSTAYLHERHHIQQAPLSALSDTRIGIDVAHYLRRLISAEGSREPLVAATGGLPIALISMVETDLRSLERLRIKPVFVFPGLPLNRRLPPKGRDFGQERNAGIRNQAWLQYENGLAEDAARTLANGPNHGGWTDYREMTRLVLRIFRHRLVEYVFAPYLPWAQVSVRNEAVFHQANVV